MDNDCETETDVLETAKKTVLEDLEIALRLQKGENHEKGDESEDSSTSESNLSSYHSDDDDNETISGSEESSTVQSEICSKYAKSKKDVRFLKNFSQ